MSMEKFILLICLLSTITTAGQNLTLKTDIPQHISLPMTDIKIKIDADHLILTYISEEPQADFLRVKYKKPQWNVFDGEAVEITFSPYGGRPGYRFLLNPSGKFFQSFYGSPKWTSRYITGKVEIQDNSWNVKIRIPFATMENDHFLNPDASEKNLFLISEHWKVNFIRNRRMTGRLEYFAWSKEKNLAKSGNLVLPVNHLSAFRKIALKKLKVDTVDADTGKTALHGIFAIPERSTVFSGSAKVILYADRDKKLLSEIPLKLASGERRKFTIPFTLEESGKHFGINLEVYDENGRLVRVSRDLPVQNPWVEF